MPPVIPFKSLCSEDFTEYIDSLNTRATRNSTRHYLRGFDSYLYEHNLSTKDLTPEIIKSWVESLLEEYGDRKIANDYLSAARRCLRYFYQQGKCNFVPKKIHQVLGEKLHEPYKFESVFKDEIYSYLDYVQNTQSNEYYTKSILSLRYFDEYLVKIKYTKRTISEAIYYGWLDSISDKHFNTLRNYSILLRHFGDYLKLKGYEVFIPEYKGRTAEYKPYVFTESEIQQILLLADHYSPHHQTRFLYIDLELPMMLRLLYGCGFRVNELLSLRMHDVDFSQNIITIRNGKNHRDRLVPISDSLAEIFKKYCQVMKVIDSPDAIVFPAGTREEQLHRSEINTDFKQILQKMNISRPSRRNSRGVCIHCLRHTFAVHSFMKADSDGIAFDDSVPFLSTYMGHNNINGTYRYLQFDNTLNPNSTASFDQAYSEVFPVLSMEDVCDA